MDSLILIKSDFSQMESKLLELSKEVVATTELELYDFEYIKGSKTLRLYVCNKETKNAVIEDCVEVDRAFTPFVENADWVPDDFVLEVSSPGMYRNLKTEEHFKSAIDQPIEVKLKPGKATSYNNTKVFNGILKKFDNEKIYLDSEGEDITIAFEDVQKANMDPPFEGV